MLSELSKIYYTEDALQYDTLLAGGVVGLRRWLAMRCTGILYLLWGPVRSGGDSVFYPQSLEDGEVERLGKDGIRAAGLEVRHVLRQDVARDADDKRVASLVADAFAGVRPVHYRLQLATNSQQE